MFYVSLFEQVISGLYKSNLLLIIGPPIWGCMNKFISNKVSRNINLQWRPLLCRPAVALVKDYLCVFRSTNMPMYGISKYAKQ